MSYTALGSAARIEPMQRMASAFFLEREHFGDFLENHGRNDEPNAHP